MTTRNLVFEIGTEEIPAMPLYAATEQLAELAKTAFDEARIAYNSVKTCSTPRRMVLSVEGLAEASEALSVKKKGPAAKIAFDTEGNPTKAAAGFARGAGVDPSALVCEADEKGVEYVYALIEHPAEATADKLPELLSGLVAQLSWPKSQRWGSGHITFSRPVRWLLALFGADVVPVEFAGLTAGRTTRGHRLIAPEEVEIASADELFAAYPKMFVVPSAKEREQSIRQQIAAFEEQLGLKADLPEDIFNEVVNLVEYPTVLLGHFDEEFLEVPPEIITDAMLEHQRYFPMYRADGSLDNAFLITGNGKPERSEVIAEGNERVVRARLADAAFFVEEDRRKPLEAYVEGLGRVVFQEKLGSVKDKAERIVKIATDVCSQAHIEGQAADDAKRAALLCKADLITGAVVEFTSLQGVMGGHYARFSGETEGVATAITDHYHPRFAGDELPRNDAGKVVALADKLDTICGIFAAGMGPTGSSDPFALRRSAIGIINILLSGLDASLASLIDEALANYEGTVDFDRDELAAQVRDFFTTRLEVIARDKGYAADVVQAVTATGMFEPAETLARIEALQSARENDPELFEDLATAYARANNLRDAELGDNVEADLMGGAETELDDAIAEAQGKVAAAFDAGDHAAAVAALAALRGPVDTFFEDVMINDENDALRKNRHRLLNKFTGVFANVADIGKLAKK